MILTSTGLIVAITIQFPPTPVEGQPFNFTTRGAVTAMTLTAPGGATVTPPLVALGLLANSFNTYVYQVSSTSWYRVG